MTPQNRLAAATVIYHPSPEDLVMLCDAMRQSSTRLFVLCNSMLPSALRASLEQQDGITIIGDGTNIGLGAAMNAVMLAAESAGFTHVILFDQDSTPDPTIPLALLERAKIVEGPLGAIGPRLMPPSGMGYKPIWYSFRYGGQPGARPVDFLPSSGSLIPVAAWRRIGPFRDDFFIDGIDVEWSFRAWQAGFRVILAEDVTMTHRWGQPNDNARQPQIFRQGSLRNAYYMRNNAYSLRLAHVPLRWKMRIVTRLAFQLLALAMHGQGQTALKSIRAGWRGDLGALN